MKPLIPLLLYIFIDSCAASETALGPAIADFRVGLANLSGGAVYAATDKADYEVNGNCIRDGKLNPCMQWGFQFSYSNTKPGTPLLCDFHFSKPVLRVDVNRVDTEKSNSSSIVLSLPSSRGEYFHPMYFIKTPDARGEHVVAVRCQLAGKEAINFKFTVNYGEP